MGIYGETLKYTLGGMYGRGYDFLLTGTYDCGKEKDYYDFGNAIRKTSEAYKKDREWFCGGSYRSYLRARGRD